MLEDINFANHMYTKISDLKFNKSMSDNNNNNDKSLSDNNNEKIKYNDFSRMSDNNNEKIKYNDNNNEKIKYNENDFNNFNNFSQIAENSKIDSSIINNKNSDLDYLYYEENKKNKLKKKKNNDIEKTKNKEIRLYILLFILFCFLNSYFIINIINLYKIQYNVSLVIRASIFLILYYLIKRFF
jgi:hypothetical protein